MKPGLRAGRAGVLVALAGVAVVGVRDLLQREHALLRNSPVLGHARYLLESIGPEVRQYLVAANNEERPFTRDQRRWVHVRPLRRPLVVEGDREPVDPEEVQSEVPHQRVPAAVAAGADLLENLGSGRGLRLEVPTDHTVQLRQRLDRGQVQLRHNVRGEHHATVSVHDECVHGALFLPVRECAVALLMRRGLAAPP
jgi:hypothetical protein